MGRSKRTKEPPENESDCKWLVRITHSPERREEKESVDAKEKHKSDTEMKMPAKGLGDGVIEVTIYSTDNWTDWLYSAGGSVMSNRVHEARWRHEIGEHDDSMMVDYKQTVVNGHWHLYAERLGTCGQGRVVVSAFQAVEAQVGIMAKDCYEGNVYDDFAGVGKVIGPDPTKSMDWDEIREALLKAAVIRQIESGAWTDKLVARTAAGIEQKNKKPNFKLNFKWNAIDAVAEFVNAHLEEWQKGTSGGLHIIKPGRIEKYKIGEKKTDSETCIVRASCMTEMKLSRPRGAKTKEISKKMKDGDMHVKEEATGYTYGMVLAETQSMIVSISLICESSATENCPPDIVRIVYRQGEWYDETLVEIAKDPLDSDKRGEIDPNAGKEPADKGGIIIGEIEIFGENHPSNSSND